MRLNVGLCAIARMFPVLGSAITAYAETGQYPLAVETAGKAEKLAEAAGNVVSQRELLDRAWPNVVVAEGSLRVTIAGLRKNLGEGQDGARYIANVTGRGYCFVAPVTHALAGSLETAPLPFPRPAPVPRRRATTHGASGSSR